MNDLTGARRPALPRKTLLIAVAAIIMLLACIKAAMSGGPYGGMMPPDYMTFGMAKPDQVTDQNPGGHRPGIVYQKVVERSGSETILRDHQKWVTVRYNAKTGNYEISDPNGSGATVMVLPPHANVKYAQPSTR